MADSERLFGHDHPDTLTACNNLAIAYNDAGRAQEALVLWERVLADSERLFGHDHPDTLTACNNLAQVRQHSGSVRLSNTATNNNRT
ncbi:tetratricopeptide repeat protein [Streptomyces tubercidicus]